jgi:hypothetical protein
MNIALRKMFLDTLTKDYKSSLDKERTLERDEE